MAEQTPRNPYTPPTARVATPVDVQPSPRRPAIVLLAVFCLCVPIVLIMPRMALMIRNFSSGLVSGTTLVEALLGLAIELFLILQILLRRNWACIALAVFIVLGALFTFFAWQTRLLQPSASAAGLLVVLTLVNLAGVALLFTPPARRWFRRAERTIT